MYKITVLGKHTGISEFYVDTWDEALAAIQAFRAEFLVTSTDVHGFKPAYDLQGVGS